MYCKFCGKQVDDNNSFCSNCGKALEKAEKQIADKSNKNTVINHLEQAKILETRIFTLDNMINVMDNKIQELRREPKVKKQYLDTHDIILWPFWIFFPIVLLIMAFLSGDFIGTMLCILSIVLIFFSNDVTEVLFSSAAIAAGVVFLINVIRMIIISIHNAKYKKEYKNYFNDMQQQYKINLSKANAIEKEKNILVDKRKQAIVYLKKIYSANIIYPKYRNFIAVLSIYEYFVSGRCDELTGHEGAYNIYENELRLNRIINTLDNILYRLDEIKQNQYYLYQALCDTKEMINSLSSEMNNISSDLSSVANSASIAAYNTKIAAEDTRLLTYINLIK